MELKEAESTDLERFCQAVSPNVEPCDYPATVHCAKCGRWFCDAHAEDEEWHPCNAATVTMAVRLLSEIERALPVGGCE